MSANHTFFTVSAIPRRLMTKFRWEELGVIAFHNPDTLSALEQGVFLFFFFFCL